MSESTVFVLDPTSKPKVLGLKLAERPADIRGLTVGFLDSGWWSFGVVLERYRELLAERFGIRAVTYHKKKERPAPKELLDELATKCQIVINGLAN
ncbi:MAG: hypothetical protein HYX94_12875 [Chloroflexi bacterium]|nr:hypothetical protein [Chloroflexota bacterium]